MSYYAFVRGYDLRIVDQAGLLSCLNEWHHQVSGENYRDLEDALHDFLCAEYVEINEDSSITMDMGRNKYREDDWDKIAPYVNGYVEWSGEDDTIWRDIFHDGIRTDETPEFIWPSEYFYHEKWSDEDIKGQIRGFDISEADPLFNEILCEARTRVSHSFDDKTHRNEVIESTIADILYERSRKGEAE